MHHDIHFINPLVIKTESDLPAGVLAAIKQLLQTIEMKLSEIKTQLATAAARSTEAFAELGTRIGDLQKKIDDLVAGATDPDVTDETFLADLTTVQNNIGQLADIVPSPTAPPA